MIYSTKALIQSIEKNSVSLNVTFIPIVGETYKGHFLLKREDIDNQFTKIEEKELKIQVSSEEFSLLLFHCAEQNKPVNISFKECDEQHQEAKYELEKIQVHYQ